VFASAPVALLFAEQLIPSLNAREAHFLGEAESANGAKLVEVSIAVQKAAAPTLFGVTVILAMVGVEPPSMQVTAAEGLVSFSREDCANSVDRNATLVTMAQKARAVIESTFEAVMQPGKSKEPSHRSHKPEQADYTNF